MLEACYKHAVANLQVKNVPEALHRRLRALARRRGRPLGEIVLDAVRRELDRARFVERLRSREPVEPAEPGARLVEAERAARNRARR